MNYLDQLNRTVLGAIKAGRIGQPVFVRCLATIKSGEADRPSTVPQLILTVQAWIGSPIDRVYAKQSLDHNLSTVCLRFRSGATALVATTTGERTGPTIDVSVLGNHGAIYHEGLLGSAAFGDLVGVREDARTAAIRRVLDVAIRSGQPQAILEDAEAP